MSSPLISGSATPPLNEGPETIVYPKEATASAKMDSELQATTAGRWTLAAQLWHRSDGPAVQDGGMRQVALARSLEFSASETSGSP
jgi:hypothetical protein